MTKRGTDQVTNEDRHAVNKAFFEAVPGRGERLTLDAVMEAAGGNTARTWKAVGHRSELWEAMQAAEDAYWDAEDLSTLKTETIAALRLAEGALTRTPLTPELRKHGWTEEYNRTMAETLSAYRADVEADTFSVTDVGQRIGRSLLTQVSPYTYDVDELKVAVGYAARMLEHFARRVAPTHDA
jgi:hypothetical protein